MTTPSRREAQRKLSASLDLTKRATGSEELRRITDALDESILNASPAQLREELASQALEEAKILAEMDAILAEAKTACGKLRFDRAKEAVAKAGRI